MCLVNYFIDTDKKIIYQNFIGQLKVKDLIFMRKAVYNDPLYDLSFDVIHDLRKSWLLMSDLELDEFTSFMANSKKDGIIKRKSIFVVDKPDKFKHVIDVYKTSIDKQKIILLNYLICSSKEEAEQIIFLERNKIII